MLVVSSLKENETLRKISGGDLALFAKSTEAFLRAASALAEPRPAVEPAKTPVAPVPAPVPAAGKKD